MVRRVLMRVAASLGVIFGSVTLIFLILHWLPGDPAVLVAGETASAITIERVRVQLGTDRPLGRQYSEYLRGLARGDLGRSYVTQEPVIDRLAAQLPSTLVLTLAASVVAIALGAGLGVVSAVRHGGWVDRCIQWFALFVVSMPPFWLGILFIVVFSVRLHWLPVLGDGGPLPSVLPVACLGIVVCVPLLRLVREGILEGLHEPYVTTLRAKGLGEARVFYVHLLRNALMATVTLLGVIAGELLSNAVVVETLFARLGIGRLTVEAITQKDIPVVQGAILLASVAYVTANLLVDLSYAVIDPRTRLRAERGAP